MAKRNSTTKGVDAPARDASWQDRSYDATSYNARALMRGHDDEFEREIAKTFGIHIKIIGAMNKDVDFSAPPYATSIITDFLKDFDRAAERLAVNKHYKRTKDIHKDHFDLLKDDFRRYLYEAKARLDKAELSAKKAAPAPKPAEKPAPAPTPNTEAFLEATSGPQRSKSAERQSKNAMGGSFVPWNKSQAISYMAANDDNVSVVFNVGDAGGGKTFSALAYALEQYANVDKIYCYRPRTVTGGGDIGAVKGGVAEKTAPYVQVFKAKLREISGSKDSFSKIEMLTPDLSRGLTLGAIVIIDEAQNLTIEQAKMLQTRMGTGAKFIFTGDISNHQNDLKGQFPGLAYLIGKLATAANGTDQKLRDGTAFIRFTEEDSEARHPLMPNILKAFNDEESAFSKAFNETQGLVRNSAHAQSTIRTVALAAQELEKADKFTRNYYEAAARSAFPVLWGGTNVVPMARATGGPRIAGAMGD